MPDEIENLDSNVIIRKASEKVNAEVEKITEDEKSAEESGL